MDHRVSQLRLLHDLLDLLQLLVIGPPHWGSDCRRDAGLSRISCDTGEAERERARASTTVTVNADAYEMRRTALWNTVSQSCGRCVLVNNPPTELRAAGAVEAGAAEDGHASGLVRCLLDGTSSKGNFAT